MLLSRWHVACESRIWRQKERKESVRRERLPENTKMRVAVVAIVVIMTGLLIHVTDQANMAPDCKKLSDGKNRLFPCPPGLTWSFFSHAFVQPVRRTCVVSASTASWTRVRAKSRALPARRKVCPKLDQTVIQLTIASMTQVRPVDPSSRTRPTTAAPARRACPAWGTPASACSPAPSYGLEGTVE